MNWTTATITISKSLEQTKAGLRIKRPKNNKPRACRIPQSAAVALRLVADQQESYRTMFGEDYANHNLIFCQPDGRYHRPDLISQIVIRRMRKAGIKRTSFHRLRHTHASNLLSKGVALRTCAGPQLHAADRRDERSIPAPRYLLRGEHHAGGDYRPRQNFYFVPGQVGGIRHPDAKIARTNRWKLNYYVGHGGELYDLQNDPGEWNNLFGNPDYRSVIEDLKGRLMDWMITADESDQVAPRWLL